MVLCVCTAMRVGALVYSTVVSRVRSEDVEDSEEKLE